MRTGRFFSGRNWIDGLGSCVSTACAIHCSLKPFLFILPSVAWLDVIMGHTFERIMLGFGVLLALTSVSWGFSKHGCYRVFFILAGGLAIIATGRYLLSVPARTLFVVPGGLILAVTHVVNTVLIDRNGACDQCRSS